MFFFVSKVEKAMDIQVEHLIEILRKCLVLNFVSFWFHKTKVVYQKSGIIWHFVVKDVVIACIVAPRGV